MGGRICLLGLALAVIGYFGPWIAHKTAALTVTGFELAEFAKFFPQVQSGALPVTRVLFLTPPVASALLLGLLAHHAASRPVTRLLATGLAALLALAALPPYPYLLDSQYRGHLALAIGGLLLVLLTPLARRLPRRALGVLAALLALTGAVPALWQFARLRPLVVALYGTPLATGWGTIICAVGFGLLLLCGILAAANRPTR
jgi:hypothetical protein